MPFEGRLMGAFIKRAEQLKKWQDSETNKTSAEVPSHRPSRIKFPDGCVFLAACAAGDKEEVNRLLDEGADVNTTNVDGLTALHQACIDENLEMAKFLVEEGADINRHDNEGWTPLHACVSSGCAPIAEFLIKNGANVAAVNNDGELPVDLAECEEMEKLLQKEIDRLNIDCDAVRTQEEKIMLEDAMKWLNNKELDDNIHTRTGATALHVAAAKGYVKVMSILIEAGADLNAQDYDGWTPFHAAAHWGQREACEMLAEKLANMNIQNHVGQTCFDVSDSEMVKFLEELRSKQEMMERDQPEIKEILLRKPRFQPMRKTSVSRTTSAEKMTPMTKKPVENDEIKAKVAAITKTEPPKVNRIVPEPEKEIIAKVAAKEVSAEPEKKRFVGQENKERDIEPWKRKKQPVFTVVPPPQEKVREKAKEDIITNESADKNLLSPEMNEEEAIDPSIIKSTVPPVSHERAESQRKTSARRARETRRPTQGVTSEELKLAQRLILQKMSLKQEHGDEKDSDEESEEEEEEEELDDKYANRFGSSSSLSDSRVGSTSSLGSSVDDADNKDYRKLYYDEKEESDKLRAELRKKESELEKTKEQLKKALQNNTKNETEKKERRALERKLSELEEEVKSLTKAKSENEKLKAENRALTRTVSKLSKKS